MDLVLVLVLRLGLGLWQVLGRNGKRGAGWKQMQRHDPEPKRKQGYWFGPGSEWQQEHWHWPGPERWQEHWH